MSSHAVHGAVSNVRFHRPTLRAQRTRLGTLPDGIYGLSASRARTKPPRSPAPCRSTATPSAVRVLQEPASRERACAPGSRANLSTRSTSTPMTPRQFTHLAAQRVLWSRPGRQLVRMVERVAPGWNYAVMNRSLDMRVNGEQWLASLLPADALVLDVGFNKGEFSTMVVQRRPKARCIGFEPAVSMQRLFEDCYPFKSQVELVAAAVSSRTGECLFSDSADGISKVLTECPETPARGPRYRRLAGRGGATSRS